MSTGSLNDYRATSGTIHIPAWGAWHATIALDAEPETPLAGSVTLEIAGLTLVGTVVSGGPVRGRSVYRVVAGAGGWGTEAAALAYSSDAGVRVATVLGDAATIAGETLDAATVPTTAAGPHFVREAGPVSRVLEQLFPQGWHVGEDGITRIGRRAASVLTRPVTRTRIAPELGVVELAADTIGDLVPGITVDGIEAVDVQHELTPDGLRSTIWGSGLGSTSRRLDAFRALLAQLDPRRAYRALYEYRVVTQSSERLNLQPVRVSTGMPELRRVRVRPGVPGCRATHAVGSRVLVGFVDADPSRPVVLAFEDAEGDGFEPSRLDLVGEDDLASAAQAAGRAVRFADTIMMPSGPAATPTPTVVAANPLAPSSLSRVFP